MNVKMNANKLSRFEENQLKAAFKDEQLKKAIQRRLAGYPLQYILGEWEFYGLPIKVGEGTLIPRQDTETLAEEIINYVKDSNKKVLDICSGTGCLAIAIKKYCKNSTVYSLELSEEAISFLYQNIKLNDVDVTVIKDDALNPTLKETGFDVILSNPPYLTKEDMNSLQKEVTFEPEMALFGGTDGLDFYRSIIKGFKEKLNDGGIFAVEIGMGQEKDVSKIFLDNGYKNITLKKDLCNIIRVITAIK